MSDPHLTITDFSRAFCSDGIVRRFQLAGVDYEHFVEHGAPASELYGHGYDAHIDRVVQLKLKAENGTE